MIIPFCHGSRSLISLKPLLAGVRAGVLRQLVILAQRLQQ